MTSGTQVDRRAWLRGVAETFGTVVGTSSTRLRGTEDVVAFAVHVTERPDDETEEDPCTVLGTSAEGTGPALLLRGSGISPLAAMEIVRSLCHRGGDGYAAGDLLWLTPGDTNLSRFFEVPPAYVLLAPEDVGLAGDHVLVAGGLDWDELLPPADVGHAALLQRRGATAKLPVTAARMKASASCMLRILQKLVDPPAIEIACHGLSLLVKAPAAPALVEPLARILGSTSSSDLARQNAAHLLDEAGAPELVLEALLDHPEVVLSAVRLRVLDLLSDGETLDDPDACGLPVDFVLDEDRVAEVEDAVDARPHAWAKWLLDHLPPLSERRSHIESLGPRLAEASARVRSRLEAAVTP